MPIRPATRTACSLDCPDACLILAETDGSGRLVSIKGAPEHPVTRGFTCAKIRGYPARLNRADRITRPLLKTDGQFREISWNQAMDLVAQRINALRETPEGILHCQGGAAKGALAVDYPQLFFGRLGTSTMRGSLCDSAGDAGMKAVLGAVEANDVRDLPDLGLRGGTIVNWGKDLRRSSTHLAALVGAARKAGATVVTITPGGDGAEDCSDAVIRIRPGTDRFLAAALARLTRQAGWDGAATARAANLTAFTRLLDALPPVESLLESCDVDIEAAEGLAALYFSPAPLTSIIGWGMQRRRLGAETVSWIAALSVLNGQIGAPDRSVFYGVSSMRNFNREWAKEGVKTGRRTISKPLFAPEVRAAQLSGSPIRMIWIHGYNLVNQAPDCQGVAEALASVDFKVCAEAFMTDTAARCDLILPCAINFEREDVTGSFLHDHVQYAAPAATPPGEARSDDDVLRELAARLSPPIPMPTREEALTAALDSPFIPISLEELRERGFSGVNRPRVAFEGLRFGHPDGLARLPKTLTAETLTADGAPAYPDYPLLLSTFVRGERIHSQIPPEEHPGASGGLPEAWLSPDHPLAPPEGESRPVRIVSPLAAVEARLSALPGLRPETVLVRRGGWWSRGEGFNRLIEAAVSDAGECAAFYDQRVRVEPA